MSAKSARRKLLQRGAEPKDHIQMMYPGWAVTNVNGGSMCKWEIFYLLHVWKPLNYPYYVNGANQNCHISDVSNYLSEKTYLSNEQLVSW